MKEKSENCKLRKYKDKKMQSEVYENLDEESHRWLQWNIEPKKVESIIEVQQHGGNKGVEDNYVLLILFVASGIQEGLFGKKIRNGIKKGWTSEQPFRMKSYTGTSYITYVKQQQQEHQIRPSSIKKRIYSLLIWLVQTKAMFMQSMKKSYKNINNLHLKSERQPGYNVVIILIVIGCLRGGMRQVANQIGRLISSKKKTKAISNEMVKAVLFESESITKKVLSGLIQEDWCKSIYWDCSWKWATTFC